MRQVNFGSIIAVLVALLTTSATAGWAVKCQPVLRDRIDPIHSPGKLYSSFNLFAGSNAVNANITYRQLRHSECSSCLTDGDMSLYWTPQLFYYDGINYWIVPEKNITVHYDQNPAAIQNFSSRAAPFPGGFKMSAGHISKRRPTNDVPGGAIRYECYDRSTQNGVKSSTAHLPQEYCPDGLSAKVGFPSCGDGRRLSSTDGSHVAYPLNGTCPPSHPVRLVSMWYDVLYDLTSFKGRLGMDGLSHLVFAQKGPNGYANDPIGYGFQGSFMNGWDESIFRRAISHCNGQGNLINDTCYPFINQTVRPKFFVSCAGTQHAPESITALASPTPTPYTGPKFSTSIMTTKYNSNGGSFVPVSLSTNTRSPTLVTPSSKSRIPIVASKPSPIPFSGQREYWSHFGCGIDDVSNRTWTDSWADSSMTRQTCVDHCHEKGKHWAGLENGDTCYCSFTPPPIDRLPRTGINGQCDSMPCAGDGHDPCGGDPSDDKYVLSMFYWCKSGDTNCPSVHPLPYDSKEVSKRDLERSERSVADPHLESASFEDFPKEFPTIIEKVSLSNGDFLGLKVCSTSSESHQPPHCVLFESHNAEVLSSKFLQWARQAQGYEWREYATLWDQDKSHEAHQNLHNKSQWALFAVLGIVPLFVGWFAFMLGLFVGETYASNASRTRVVVVNTEH
ncbi:hypothetical protein IWX49DRAFT_179226 [Phyllosticta citricarpa]|uniref:WSC domain-containing protein n=1 Tax=Phyllosticta citricarpa TaxID=55181 RepID=A0ABR1M272_9PEZI